MSYGLRVWDASGNLRLDISDRITRFWGEYTISFTTTSAESPKYISVPDMTTDGTWFVLSSSNNVVCYVEGARVRAEKMYPYMTSTATILVFRF